MIMPYILQDERDKYYDKLLDMPIANAGDLNFCITTLCDQYLRAKGLRYEHINTVIGALECAKLELYRRIAAPYENRKWDANGDVYSPEILS
jgi:hypothetical protein